MVSSLCGDIISLCGIGLCHSLCRCGCGLGLCQYTSGEGNNGKALGQSILLGGEGRKGVCHPVPGESDGEGVALDCRCQHQEPDPGVKGLGFG